MKYLNSQSTIKSYFKNFQNKKFLNCIVERVDPIKFSLAYYLLFYIEIEYNLYFYRLNNIINYQQNGNIGNFLIYFVTKRLIVRSIYKITLEVACINYKALSLYYYHNFQINFKRIRYYTNTQHCFTANNTQLKSHNYIRHSLLLESKYKFYYTSSNC
nr:hypothetical protein [Madagascaria erythrocladioides]